MRTCSPVAMAGQALAWAGVGASNAPSNQSRTAGVKCDNGKPFRGYPGAGEGPVRLAPGQLARPREDRVEHRLGELARERVLLAGVKAAEQSEPFAVVELG